MENRRNAERLRSRLDDVLETLAMFDAFPARRAEDPALQEAVREARRCVAQILATLDRMEQGGGRGAADAPGAGTPGSERSEPEKRRER